MDCQSPKLRSSTVLRIIICEILFVILCKIQQSETRSLMLPMRRNLSGLLLIVAKLGGIDDDSSSSFTAVTGRIYPSMPIVKGLCSFWFHDEVVNSEQSEILNDSNRTSPSTVLFFLRI